MEVLKFYHGGFIIFIMAASLSSWRVHWRISIFMAALYLAIYLALRVFFQASVLSRIGFFEQGVCRRVPASSTTASRQLRYTSTSKLTVQTTVSLRGGV